MRILVVDDEKLLVKGVKFNLENEGYEVECAYDGAAAGAGHIQLGLTLSRNAIGYSDASRRLDVRVGFAAGGDGSGAGFRHVAHDAESVADKEGGDFLHVIF